MNENERFNSDVQGLDNIQEKAKIGEREFISASSGGENFVEMQQLQQLQHEQQQYERGKRVGSNRELFKRTATVCVGVFFIGFIGYFIIKGFSGGSNVTKHSRKSS